MADKVPATLSSIEARVEKTITVTDREIKIVCDGKEMSAWEYFRHRYSKLASNLPTAGDNRDDIPSYDGSTTGVEG